MKVVLDTSSVVAAVRSDAGASRRLMIAALERRLTLLVSVPLLIEYQAVLTRLEHRMASGLSSQDIDILLDAIAAVAEPVRLAFLWRPAAPDPDDDMVVEAAVNGRADAIVTFNERHFTGVASQSGIQVLSPGKVWRQLETGQ